MAPFCPEIVKRGVVPSPGRCREDPDDTPVPAAGPGAPALQKHFVDGGGGEEIALQGKGAVGEVAEAGPGLITVRVEAVPQDEGPGVDVEVAQGRLGVADAGAAQPSR